MNPRAAIAGGMCYGVNENLKRNALWPPEFPLGVSEAIGSEIVRFFGGVFECPSQQAAELYRSCGAVEDERLFQPMHGGESRAGPEHRPLRQRDSNHRLAHAQHTRERQMEARVARSLDMVSCALRVKHKVDVVMCESTQRDHDTMSRKTWRRSTLERTRRGIPCADSCCIFCLGKPCVCRKEPGSARQRRPDLAEHQEDRRWSAEGPLWSVIPRDVFLKTSTKRQWRLSVLSY